MSCVGEITQKIDVLPRISLVAKVQIASAALLPPHPRRWGELGSRCLDQRAQKMLGFPSSKGLKV